MQISSKQKQTAEGLKNIKNRHKKIFKLLNISISVIIANKITHRSKQVGYFDFKNSSWFNPFFKYLYFQLDDFSLRIRRHTRFFDNVTR